MPLYEWNLSCSSEETHITMMIKLTYDVSYNIWLQYDTNDIILWNEKKNDKKNQHYI